MEIRIGPGRAPQYTAETRADAAREQGPTVRPAGRDTFVLTGIGYGEIWRMRQDGWIEVDGKRYAVPERVGAMLERMEAAAQERTLASRMAADARYRIDRMREKAKYDAQERHLMDLALKIYARISSGGRVPKRDERWLARYSPSLYAQAKMNAAVARAKKKKEHKGEIGDEEEAALEDRTRERVQDDGDLEDYARYHVEATIEGGEITGASVAGSSPE